MKLCFVSSENLIYNNATNTELFGTILHALMCIINNGSFGLGILAAKVNGKEVLGMIQACARSRMIPWGLLYRIQQGVRIIVNFLKWFSVFG